MNSKGFSLIEVLIGVAILTGMCLLLYSTMNRSLEGKVRVESRDEIIHGARVGLGRMIEDLAQAYMAGKAMAGSESQYVSGFKGAEDHVDFSMMGGVHIIKGMKDTDSVTVGYSLKSDENGFYKIMRRQSDRLSDKLDEGGLTIPLLDHVKTFKLSYYDSNKKEWVSEWDSSQLSVLGRLPMAVKIELTLVEPDPDNPEKSKAEFDYSTMARIELYKNEISF